MFSPELLKRALWLAVGQDYNRTMNITLNRRTPRPRDSKNGESSTVVKKNIVVIGAGVVGRATGNGFLGKGHRVVFCDTSADVRSKFTAEGNEVCKDYDLHDFDVSMICVNTPTYNNRIQYAYLEQAIEVLGTRLADISDYHLVSVRCTMLPGTTEEMLIPMLEYYSQKKSWKRFWCMRKPRVFERTHCRR